ncbi:MAG TPA: WcaF family extracellular polysaccharide biosynthesis acetyltransferase [Bryobacteraceae bacterium]|nr:WcaF family extracellular polysaccharide biosynthesis acetyltransferase [Bryobacteraceae bacterium]
MTPDLSAFDNSWYHPGRPRVVQALWFFLGLPLLRFPLIPMSSFRVLLLRLFGAQIGRGVVVKPSVRVKYPWLLRVGAHSWIGEDVWIDNLASVRLGSNVCISQGAYLCTGNHDWSDPAFGLMAQPIVVENGSWIGARAIVCPGVSVGQCGIAAAGSVLAKDVPPFEIHAGNPASFVRYRPLPHALPAHQPVLRA